MLGQVLKLNLVTSLLLLSFTFACSGTKFSSSPQNSNHDNDAEQNGVVSADTNTQHGSDQNTDSNTTTHTSVESPESTNTSVSDPSSVLGDADGTPIDIGIPGMAFAMKAETLRDATLTQTGQARITITAANLAASEDMQISNVVVTANQNLARLIGSRALPPACTETCKVVAQIDLEADNNDGKPYKASYDFQLDIKLKDGSTKTIPLKGNTITVTPKN